MSHLSKSLSKIKQEIMAQQLKNFEVSRIEDEAAKNEAFKQRNIEMNTWLYSLDTTLSATLYDLQRQEREESKALEINPKRFIGPVNFTSGHVIVSDPCYELGTWCQHVLTGVKNGSWMATKTLSDEGDWGVRIARLEAYIGEEPKDHEFEHLSEVQIGVDSGQAGFFDRAGYRNTSLLDGTDFSLHSLFQPDEEDSKEQQESDIFYGACAALTLSSEQSGVFAGGVVSSSGYGDGSYDLCVRYDDNQDITAMRLIFISEDEEEEEDDE